MDTFSIIAFTLSASALAFSLRNHERINALEKKLQELDIIPGKSDSEVTPVKTKPPV